MVGKDRNFLDELFDKSLIEPCDVGFLLGDEVLQLLDPVHGLFPVVAIDLGLFLLVAEPENLIGDGIVVLLVVGLLDALFCQEVRGVGLLKQGITHVLLVAENLVDGAGVPLFLARAGEDSVCHKSGGNFVHAGAFEVFPVDAFYDFSLLRIDDQVSVIILGVAEKAIVIDVYLSLLEAVLKSQLHVLGKGLTLLLSQGSHDG